MSEPNPVVVRQAILQIVDNQLRDNVPPETKRTLQRLVAAGYSTEDAKRLIGVVVATEVFELLKHKRPYDRDRYVAALKRLPQLPGDDQAE